MGSVCGGDVMTVVALANLGTHDLIKNDGGYQLPGEVSHILNEPNQWSNYSLPIILPFLEGIREKTKTEPILILFVTWQEEVDDSFHRKDTEHLGRLIKKWLEPDGRPDYQGLAEKVVLSPPIPREPHNYDLMLQWFEGSLPECIKSALGSPTVNILNPPLLHISITAGTPAMNIALLFKSFGLGIGRVENVWHIDESSERSIILETGHILAGEPLRKTFKAHLDRFDYEAASELAKYICPKWVISAAHALADIRRSDFNGALNRLPKKKARGEILRPWINLLAEGRKELNGAEDRTVSITDGVRAIHSYQIAEMDLQFQRKDYPEALTALYRLQESLVRITFEQVTGLPGQISYSESRKKEWTERLRSFLAKHDETSEKQFNCDRYTHSRVIQQIKPDHPVSKWVDRIYSNQGKQSLGDLRNKCRVAHGFCEVSDKAIRAAGWPGGIEEIVLEARKAAEEVLGKLPEPPNQKVHDRILSTLV